LGRKGRPIKASTLATDRNRIDAHVRPLLGAKAVQSLEVKDIEQMQADITAGKTAVKPAKRGKRKRGGIARGGAGTAGRTLGMLRTIFEHAVRRGMIASNPAKGARKFADRKRKKRLSLDQIRELGAAMRTAEADGENPTGLAAIRLILFTGFRRSEALGVRREWLLPAGGVDFPDTKSGPQARPIGRSAMKLLNERFRASNEAWAFPADRGEGHFVGLPKVLARVAAMAGLKGITAHVLRHTYASIAAELGFSELVIAGLLGHSAGSVTSGYVHLDTALVAAADRVSTTIRTALDGRSIAATVPLHRAVSK
jgi:integrase